MSDDAVECPDCGGSGVRAMLTTFGVLGVSCEHEPANAPPSDVATIETIAELMHAVFEPSARASEVDGRDPDVSVWVYKTCGSDSPQASRDAWRARAGCGVHAVTGAVRATAGEALADCLAVLRRESAEHVRMYGERMRALEAKERA